MGIYKLTTHKKRIATLIVFIIVVEMIWEFTHHYLYPEKLQQWVDAGKKVEDFSKHYDDAATGTIGAFGRLLMYAIILWLSIQLYKLKRTNIWNPILLTFLCGLGILSSIVFILYFLFGIETPKPLGFLLLFFIPGLPFLLLYWMGVGLLTKQPKTIAVPS